MGEPPPGSPAEEAERLVVAAVAALSVATRGWLASHGDVGGAQECCACPVCRGIAAVRDPSPELVEKLATGAAELAGGVTSVLRALGDAFGRPAGSTSGPAPSGSAWPDSAPSGSAASDSAPSGSAASGAAPAGGAARTGAAGTGAAGTGAAGTGAAADAVPDTWDQPPEGGTRGGDADPWRVATADPDISHQTSRQPAKIAKKAVHKVVPKGDPLAPLATNNGDAAS